MIRDKYNLRCPKGHMHYSPAPEEFVGRQCFYPTEKNDPTSRKKCSEPMKRFKR